MDETRDLRSNRIAESPNGSHYGRPRKNPSPCLPEKQRQRSHPPYGIDRPQDPRIPPGQTCGKEQNNGTGEHKFQAEVMFTAVTQKGATSKERHRPN
jgi:hypothetical protein